MERKSLLARIGPAFIVGACVIGPGSVTLMSTTGANYGYQLIWLSLLAGALMASFLALFMRFGILCEETFLDVTARKLGRWFSVLCGITIFLVSAAFQFGNSLGVTSGMEALCGDGVPQYVWPAAFTAAAIVFMFGFRQIYVILEKTMTFFLVFMVCAFLVNLIWAIAMKPNPVGLLGQAAAGACTPRLPEGVDWVLISGLVGTTFCISAAFLQPYLVKAKGWTERDLASGLTDTVMASVMLTLIGTIIMMTAATVLYPHAGRVDFAIMIGTLQTVFGPYAKIVFSVGFWAAAFSSFITNSLIGGVLLNDGLGLGGKLESTTSRVLASCVLLVGMTTALFIIHQDVAAKAAASAPSETVESTAGAPRAALAKKVDLKVAAILVGQAATMLAVPLGAIAMVVVLLDDRLTPGRALPIWAKLLVVVGACVLLGIAGLTYFKIQPALVAILGLG
ncbi:MAG TPA: divalent metal cation transporter [Thermoguttaceae bacterium]|nr:divalent metal cation transporter [Thermoguttaceae bacterium]